LSANHRKQFGFLGKTQEENIWALVSSPDDLGQFTPVLAGRALFCVFLFRLCDLSSVRLSIQEEAEMPKIAALVAIFFMICKAQRYTTP